MQTFRVYYVKDGCEFMELIKARNAGSAATKFGRLVGAYHITKIIAHKPRIFN